MNLETHFLIDYRCPQGSIIFKKPHLVKIYYKELPDFNNDDYTFSCMSNNQGAECTITMSNGQSFSGKREHGPVIIFRNIPYAESPTGNRRWKEPTIKTSYSGPIDGTKQGYACATVRSTDNPDDNGESEDCLHVNVSVAEWVLENKRKVPVVAYVHGGGHNGGTNGNPLHYLADQGLVVFNIRWVFKLNLDLGQY